MRAIALSRLTETDNGNNLNGMPGFGEIETLVILRELAIKKIAELGVDHPQSLKIAEALSLVQGMHWIADNHDTSNQCSDRPILRFANYRA